MLFLSTWEGLVESPCTSSVQHRPIFSSTWLRVLMLFHIIPYYSKLNSHCISDILDHHNLDWDASALATEALHKQVRTQFLFFFSHTARGKMVRGCTGCTGLLNTVVDQVFQEILGRLECCVLRPGVRPGHLWQAPHYEAGKTDLGWGWPRRLSEE